MSISRRSTRCCSASGVRRGVRWLRLRLQLVDPEGIQAIADPAGVCAELHRLEAQSTERLARFSKMALDAGVAERRIRLVERQARALAHAFTTALDQHSMASRLSNADRAEFVRLFAQQLEGHPRYG